jgi:hypothetical protein
MNQNPFFGGVFNFGLPAGLPMLLPSVPFVPPISMPMFPVGAFTGSPVSMANFAAPSFIKPEMVAEMQKAVLQNQKQQLQEIKKYITDYANAIDQALNKIEEEMAKTEKAPAQ